MWRRYLLTIIGVFEISEEKNMLLYTNQLIIESTQ